MNKHAVVAVAKKAARSDSSTSTRLEVSPHISSMDCLVFGAEASAHITWAHNDVKSNRKVDVTILDFMISAGMIRTTENNRFSLLKTG